MILIIYPDYYFLNITYINIDNFILFKMINKINMINNSLIVLQYYKIIS